MQLNATLVYARANAVIGIYGMGLTQHVKGAATVQMLANPCCCAATSVGFGGNCILVAHDREPTRRHGAGFR